MADPVSIPPQAPEALQAEFSRFVSEDLWRFAHDGIAPKEQLRDYFKKNPDILSHSFKDADDKPTNILIEMMRARKDTLAAFMLHEYELPKAMIEGYPPEPAAVGKPAQPQPEVVSPLEFALKRGYSGVAHTLIEKGADLNRVTHGDTHLLQLAAIHGGPKLLDAIDKRMPADEMKKLLCSYCALPVNMRERPSMLVPLLQKHSLAKADTDKFARKWEGTFNNIQYDKRSGSFNITSAGFCDDLMMPHMPQISHWVDEFAVRDMAATMLLLQKGGLSTVPAETIGATMLDFTTDEYRGGHYLEQIKTLVTAKPAAKDPLLDQALLKDDLTVAKTLIKAGAKPKPESLFQAIWAEKPQIVQLMLDSNMPLDITNSTNVGGPQATRGMRLMEANIAFSWSSKAKFEQITQALVNKGVKVKNDEQYFLAVETALAEPQKSALIDIFTRGGLPLPTNGKGGKSLSEALDARWAAQDREWAKNNPGKDRFTEDTGFAQLLLDRASIKEAVERWKQSSPQRSNDARGTIGLDETFRMADGTKAPELPADVLVMKKRVIAA